MIGIIMLVYLAFVVALAGVFGKESDITISPTGVIIERHPNGMCSIVETYT